MSLQKASPVWERSLVFPYPLHEEWSKWNMCQFGPQNVGSTNTKKNTFRNSESQWRSIWDVCESSGRLACCTERLGESFSVSAAHMLESTPERPGIRITILKLNADTWYLYTVYSIWYDTQQMIYMYVISQMQYRSYVYLFQVSHRWKMVSQSKLKDICWGLLQYLKSSMNTTSPTKFAKVLPDKEATTVGLWRFQFDHVGYVGIQGSRFFAPERVCNLFATSLKTAIVGKSSKIPGCPSHQVKPAAPKNFSDWAAFDQVWPSGGSLAAN